MIYGTKNWNDKSIRYDQTKRIIEKFLADLKQSKQVNFWLESCNVCASCCAIEAVNGEFLFPLPKVDCKNIVSYADLLFDYIYTLDTVKVDGVCDNEIADNLVKGINAISNCNAKIINGINNKALIQIMINSLKEKKAVILSYTTDYNSGHYICVVAYDDSTNEFITYDSWSNNKHCKNNGVQERYNCDFFEKRLRNKCIITIEKEIK